MKGLIFYHEEIGKKFLCISDPFAMNGLPFVAGLLEGYDNVYVSEVNDLQPTTNWELDQKSNAYFKKYMD